MFWVSYTRRTRDVPVGQSRPPASLWSPQLPRRAAPGPPSGLFTSCVQAAFLEEEGVEKECVDCQPRRWNKTQEEQEERTQ